MSVSNEQQRLNALTVLHQTYHYEASLRMYEQVPDGGPILDVGCGSGYFTKWLSEHRGSAIGVDIVEDFVLLARSRHGIEAHVMEAGQLDFPDASFASVTADNVLEHCLDPVVALQEIHRVLRPGGSLLALIPPDGNNPYDRTLAHVWKTTVGEIREVAESCGFEVCSLETWDTWNAFGFVYPPSDDQAVFLLARKKNAPLPLAKSLSERLRKTSQAHLGCERESKEFRAGEHFRRGLAELDSRAYAQSRASFMLALSINPSFKEAYFALGRSWEMEGRLEEAIGQYRWVLQRLNRDHSGARIRLLGCLVSMGDEIGAKQELEALRRFNPDIFTDDQPALLELTRQVDSLSLRA